MSPNAPRPAPHSSVPPPFGWRYVEAVGTPAPFRQDTTIVTEFAAESKITRAVVAGPRITPVAS